MIMRYPYRAIICGEEDFVEGWRNGNLVTRRGEFIVRQLYRESPIESARIMEVANLQLDQKGEWLVNGRKLPLSESGRGGVRFAALDDDEDVRVHKEKIRGVVWVHTTESGNITAQLDRARDFWKSSVKPASGFLNETHAMWIELVHNVNAGHFDAAWAHVIDICLRRFMAVLKCAFLFRLAPKHLVVAIRVEWGINVNQINAGGWQFLELFQVVAAIYNTRIHKRGRLLP
jgi:hypothetical protein